jgi:hypothetical protein
MSGGRAQDDVRSVISGVQRFTTSGVPGGDIKAPARATAPAPRPARGRRVLNLFSSSSLEQSTRAAFTAFQQIQCISSTYVDMVEGIIVMLMTCTKI